MPRGVPKNGKRAPRRVSAALVSDTSLAGSALDGAGEPASAYQAAPASPVELTPDQIRIKDLENQIALERGRKDPELEVDEIHAPGSNDNICIHFLEDGFTALGTVWYRGQELEFEPGSQAYKDTFDRFGRSWLDMRNDEFAQVERYQRVMFRSGPWPGKSYKDAANVQFQTVRDSNGRPLPSPSEEELSAVEKIEARRNRAAPKLPAR